MKALIWNKKRGCFMLELPGERGFLLVERLQEGEWAWEYNAEDPRQDVRGRAATAEAGMTLAFNAAKRDGRVEA